MLLAPYERIDKGIPIPEIRRLGNNRSKRRPYPWDGMEIGDSFLISFGRLPNNLGGGVRVAGIINQRRNRHGGDYCYRKRSVELGDTENGWRVWKLS